MAQRTHLPVHLALCIVRKLPTAAQACAGRRLNHEAHSAIPAQVVSARDPQLPLWSVEELYHNMETSNERAKLLECRAYAGDLASITRLRQLGCPQSAHVATAASAGGHLTVLKWLRAQCPPCPLKAGICGEAAASAGHLEVLQWLFSDFFMSPFDTGVCAEAAAAGGHLEVVQWIKLQDKKCCLDTGVCTEAAAAGHLGILQWLRMQEPPMPWNVGNCLVAATAAGHLSVVKLIISQEPTIVLASDAALVAAATRQLDILQYLRSQGAPWDEHTAAAAAGAGCLTVLQWMRNTEPPCPWDERVTTAAARGGHVAALKWLRDAGCPLDIAACLHAAQYKHPEVMHWLSTEAIW
eukprot:GHUV01002396.1.p1 GENE.GHUV01002396.1~~GHUV01002396.1.p1  ORF type:complete len:353 (+),score=74.83 GHUV01002396.1:237-1295(+)